MSRITKVQPEEIPDLPGTVAEPTIEGLPEGYRYGVTHYADLILRDAFPQRYADLIGVLDAHHIEVDEILKGGGSRAPQTIRFDESFHQRGWGKRIISISKLIDGEAIHQTRGHEIDMFATASDDSPYPGVAVEMEWNNKDPFFDRDLLNFMALHREGALAVGVIVTRGPSLQRLVGNTVKTSSGMKSNKYGQSTTHWDKIIPRVNLGGGGECPLIIIGIEPQRVNGIEWIEDAVREGKKIW